MTDKGRNASRRHHDVGGAPLPCSAIDRAGKPDRPWQVEFTATLWALIHGTTPVMTLDEMRRGVEDLPPEAYDAMPYYDRQTRAVAAALVERGHLSWNEIEGRIAMLARGPK